MNFSIEDYKLKAREAVAEGIVLLKNDNNVLPLSSGNKVAVFGRNQCNYYKSGTGSGGLVNTSYVVSILDALNAEENLIMNQKVQSTYAEWIKDNPFDIGIGWATEPWFQKEMPLTDELIGNAIKESDVAIVMIGRSSGEDKDNKVEAGSYLLTEDEEAVISKVCATFDQVIVLLNTGNIIDMSWVTKYNPSAVCYVWQGGQEGGNGVVDVLMGRVNPSGKLPDTIVEDVQDIPSTAGFGDIERAVYSEDIYVGYRYFETFAPEKVMYPFGFGLSYTNFTIEMRNVHIEKFLTENTTISNYYQDGITLDILVTNIGDVSGKEVVQVYANAPQGLLGKPVKSLVGFTKSTLLAPGESEVVQVNIPAYYLASYDDSGVTGNKSAYVLESGKYEILIGNNVRDTKNMAEFQVPSLIILEQLTEAIAPQEQFDILRPLVDDNGILVKSHTPVSTRTTNYDERIQSELSTSYEIKGDLGYKLVDVANGKIDMMEFVSQFSKEDLAAITRGEGMCSPKVTPGIAGAMGGVTESLQAFGIPVAGCSDGPSGIRMDCGTLAFAMPNGTLLASTFNDVLCEELYEWEALELRKNKVDNLLGPGMNIHRSPLNGRNFEYFSEDPLLTGKLAVAQLKGLHKYGVTGTIKHFICNNQETNRHGVETICSERAIREIYLKGFELAVREAGAYSIMTSYNPVNGYWTASHYELLTTILRDEWGFDGIVMTDWWAKGNFTGEEGTVRNNAVKVQAQNDLNMVNPDASDMSCDNSIEELEAGRVTIGEYQRSAANICSYILRTPVFRRMIHGEDEIDSKLKDFVFEGNEQIAQNLEWYVGNESSIDGSKLATAKGDLNQLAVSVKTRGVYHLNITCRAMSSEKELAQIPVTIFKDKEFISTLTITGEQKEWQTYTIDNIPPSYMNNFYLKLLFGQGGMEIKDITFILVEDLEEKIKAAMS